MKKSLLLFLFLTILGNSMFSQTRSCGTYEWHVQQLANNPEYANNREAIEQHTANYTKNPSKSRQIKTIPVVIHVVYNSAAQNISDAQILAQIDILNKDFRRLNADRINTPAVFDSLAADCEIQFCLAQIDPNGNPTTGIIRKFTTSIGFVGNDAVKFAETGGDPAWDRNKYLNIWVCNLTDNLGYSSFPGSPSQLDGVVIRHSAFGTGGSTLYPYNQGRTTTHEVGHWLNLLHIWGDDGTGCAGTDMVQDTPNQAGYNVSCPIFPRISCTNGPNGDMYMNYMDYTNDACMNMFTKGQKARIDAIFAFGGPRFNLLSSNGCNTNSCNVPDSLFAVNLTSNSTQVGWRAMPSANSYIFQYRLATDTFWNSLTMAENKYTFLNLPPLTAYDFRVLTQCNSGNSIFSNPFRFTTLAEPCLPPDSLIGQATAHNAAIVSWQAIPNAKRYIVRYKAILNMNWIVDTLSSNRDTLLDLIPTTTYEFQVSTICLNSIGNWSSAAEFTTPAMPILCSNTYEPNNSINAAKPLALNTTIASMIASSSDKDYFIFKTTNDQPKIKLTLSNLPKNYNLSLLASNGKELIRSQNKLNLSEEIRYNTPTVGGTYYAYIFPASKTDYDAASCYNLIVNTNGSNFRVDNPYPNPDKIEEDEVNIFVNDQLTLYYPAAADDNVDLKVFSITGQVLMQAALVASYDGMNTYDLSQHKLSTGLYVVHVIAGNNKMVSKFLLR